MTGFHQLALHCPRKGHGAPTALHYEETSRTQAKKHPRSPTVLDVPRIIQEHSRWWVFFNPGLFKFAPTRLQTCSRFPNQWHAEMVLDCDYVSRSFDILNWSLGNKNAHPNIVFPLTGEPTGLHASVTSTTSTQLNVRHFAASKHSRGG